MRSGPNVDPSVVSSCAVKSCLIPYVPCGRGFNKRVISRYHKISAATGLTQPEEIVNKFFFIDEITEDLNKEIAERKEAVAVLEQQQRDAQDAFDKLKYHHHHHHAPFIFFSCFSLLPVQVDPPACGFLIFLHRLSPSSHVHRDNFVETRWKDVDAVESAVVTERRRKNREEGKVGVSLRMLATMVEGLMAISMAIEEVVRPSSHPTLV